jgi:hypothetical protein
MLRLMRDFLTLEYSLTPEMRDLLASVSPRTIDRILKPAKDQGRLRGLSLTKPGNLLRDQIPVRVMFNGDQRKPGFFEFDRAAHCGSDASGQFCQTLTGTDVGSGWTEEHALLNSAHPWVKERIQQIRDELPFPLLGIDSDKGLVCLLSKIEYNNRILFYTGGVLCWLSIVEPRKSLTTRQSSSKNKKGSVLPSVIS